MHSRLRQSLIALAFFALIMPAAHAQDAAPLSLIPPAAEQPAPAKPEPAPPPPTAATVIVRVGEHETYDRVVFDWPRAVPYKLTREGNRATMHFSAKGSVQLKAAAKLQRGKGFTSGTDADGNLLVSFDVDATTSLKDFFNGNSIAVDITGPALKEMAAPPPQPAPPAKPEAAAKPPAEAPKPAEASKADPAKAPAPAASSPPAAAASATPAPDAKPAAPSAVAPPEPVTVGTAIPQAIGTAAPVATPAPAAAQPAPSSPSPPPSSRGGTALLAPAVPLVATVQRDVPTFNVGTKPVLITSLDPHTLVRAAVWARAGYGYIVFDKKLTLGTDVLTAGQPASLVNLQLLDSPTYTGYRFAIPDKVELHADKEGTIWRLYVTKAQPEVPVSATLVAQPDFALGARYLLPLPDAPDPLRVFDPVVGDELVVIPLGQSTAFSIMRRMADFMILPAAQGLVIKPFIDKLIARPVSDGIEITSDSGLHLSPSTQTGAAQMTTQKLKSAAAGKSLFEFSTWAGKPGENFTHGRQRMQQTIVDVPERERSRARFEFARFYFARGYGAEALALLEYLKKDIPDIAAHSDFLALSGAAKIMANHPDDGLKDIDAANMPDIPEIKLWQAIGNAKLGNWVDAERDFSATEPLLESYPEYLSSRYLVLAVESALAVGNDHEAADWLNVLQGMNTEGMDPAIDYLHGVLHAKAGRAQAATAAWQKAANSNDNLYKVRAEMALIDLNVANQSLSAAQAADRLEALRFAWRGDDLEVDILHRLGLFYIKARNIKAGFSTLSQAVQLYPHSPMVSKIHDEMSQAFHDVFLGDMGKNLSPLDALAIYQQYRDTLMPTGDDGLAITRLLAERLAAIDLLDQACELLEDMAKNKLKGIDKAHVVLRLAALRMVDHKAQAALAALDLSNGDTLPPALQQEHQLLHAKALLELGRNAEALSEISNDNGLPAKILRAEINMASKNWSEASKNLLGLVGSPPPAGQIFTEQQADWLLRAAVAMAMGGDQPGLDRLAIDYAAAMAGTSQNDAFKILVEPDRAGDMKDIAAAQKRITEVDMFQGFLNYYRKSDEPDQAAPDAKKQ